MSQKNMTNPNSIENEEICPAKKLLKVLSGKLRPEIFSLAAKSTLRFSMLLREIEGANRQSLSIALKELEEMDLLERVVIKQKPLHIEYYLTQKGKSLIPIFQQLRDNAIVRQKEIQDLVKQGFMVRTRSDIETYEAKTNDFTRAKAAFSSGAQVISTDFFRPGNTYGTPYFVQPPQQKDYLNNPLNSSCK